MNRPAHHLPPEALTQWTDHVLATYGLDLPLGAEEIGTVLDVARDVSAGVNRPGAPLTTFLVGLALGRAVPAGTSAEEATATLTRLAETVQDEAAGWATREQQ